MLHKVMQIILVKIRFKPGVFYVRIQYFFSAQCLKGQGSLAWGCSFGSK